MRIVQIPIDDLSANTTAGFTPKRPWSKLTDAEWAVLEPQLQRVNFGGRPVHDARARMNAMLYVVVKGLPRRSVPEVIGKPDTISRYFRRWAKQGLWTWLVGLARAPDAPKVLQRMDYWLCRAARRAMRVLGLIAAQAMERLGALTAMPVLPVYMPRAMNLEFVRNWQRRIIDATMAEPLAAPIGLLQRLLSLEKHFQGRPWHKRFAPS